MIYRALTFIFIFMLLPFMAYAQISNVDKAKGGSIYSSIGLGFPTDIVNPNTNGMGLKGLSVFGGFVSNPSNPALWGVNAHTQGTLVVGLENLYAQDHLGTATSSSVTIDQFQLVLPIMRQRLGLSFGFTPVTRSNYAMFNEGTVTIDDGSGQNEILFLNDEKGSGGINKMEFGLGYRINNYLAVGYAGSFHFGSLNREVSTFFDTQRFDVLQYSDNISGIGFGHKAGVFGRFVNVLRSDDEIGIGGTVTFPVSINAERKAESFRNIDGRIRSVEVFRTGNFGEGNLELPLKFDAGLTYNPNRFYSFSAEFTQENWSDGTFTYNSTEEQYLTDRTTIGIGGQYHPYRADAARGFFSNFKYSAGVTFDTGHLLIDDNQIETLKFHTGLGFFSPRTASSIDMSFFLGFRGTDQANLIKERVWGIRLSLNLAEWMFEQRRFD